LYKKPHIETIIEELQENYRHILAVNHERTILFEKRQKETKRTLKTYHRLREIPSSQVLFPIFRAHIQYFLYLSAEKAIKRFLKNDIKSNNKYSKSLISEINSKSFSPELIKNNCLKKLYAKELQRIKPDIGLRSISDSDINLFFTIVFTMNDDYVIKSLNQFIQKNISSIVSTIFQKITIIDSDYTQAIIKVIEDIR
jgi:hypothetical protein